MKRRAVALLPWLIAATCAPAGAARQDNAIAAALNDLQVRLERDVPYGPDARQRFDAYLPGVAKGPILLVVHAGAWDRGDKRSPATIVPKVRYWTARGYVVVFANYRLLPQAHPLDQARDVARALAAVQRKARDWGADPGGVIFMGHSAGGHLVALLGAEPALAREQGAGAWRGTIVLDGPAFDVPALMAAPHASLYDRAFGSHPAYWKTVSPLHQLSRDAPPLLAVCSRRRQASCAEAEAFARRAAAMRLQVQVQPVDHGHAELDRLLGLPGPYSASVERWINSIL